MKKKKSVLLVFILLISIVLVSIVYAEFSGNKWGISNVAYYSISSFGSEVNNAASKWNGIADIGFSSTSTYLNAQIYVRDFPSDEEDMYYYQGFYAFGIPGSRFNDPWNIVDGSTFTSGNMLIVRRKVAEKGYSDRAAVFCHEWGHLLGLDHTTKWFTSSIMDESDVFKLTGPTSYDESELDALY